MPKVFIIAEAGVNHNGSIVTAKKLVEAAAKAGADAVKFQTFKAENLVTASSPKASYQLKTTAKSESQFKMLKRLELDEKMHRQLMAHCQKMKIQFLSTPFDIESLQFLNQLGIDSIKIPSGEMTNLPFLREVGQLRKKVLLSTGMADMTEIQRAINILVQSGTMRSKITVLHCHTAYPTEFKDANLKAITTLRQKLGIFVGYSDHTPGIEAAVAAVALGATVIEKHFTLSKKMKGPDHQASLEPDELKTMISAIRHVEDALGDGQKLPTAVELQNRKVVRKSIVASRDIKCGELFNAQNLTVKRPENGLSPMKWDTVIGKVALKDFLKDEAIQL